MEHANPIIRTAAALRGALAGLSLTLLLTPAAVHAQPAAEAEGQARAAAIAQEIAHVDSVLESAGGWHAWNARLAPCHADILARVAAAEAAGRELLVGPSGSLFTTALTRYALAQSAPPESGGDADIRSATGFTAVVDLSRQLAARGIDIIFVPIPQKEECYPETLSPLAPRDVPLYPQRYRYMKALLEAGVEVIDLLPAWRAGQRPGAPALFPDTDLHWSNHAMGLAACAIAARLDRYTLAHASAAEPCTAEPFRIEAQGPLVKYFLPEEEWTAYPNLVEDGLRILLPGGRPYEYDAIQESPVLLIGDSFMMRARSGGSFAARLAYESGVPVTGHMENQKGAQAAARIFARKGPAFYEKRRVVVWYVVGGMLSRAWSTVDLPA